jgi:hypothetical protein
MMDGTLAYFWVSGVVIGHQVANYLVSYSQIVW